MSSLAAMLEPLSVQQSTTKARQPPRGGHSDEKTRQGLPRKLRRQTTLPCQRSVCDQLWHLRRNNVVEFPDRRRTVKKEEEEEDDEANRPPAVASDVLEVVQSYQRRHLAW